MERSLQTRESAAGRRERGEPTKERILEVASGLMASRGYSGTSIGAIIESAGVGPSTIYWHFGTKEGLLAAVVERSAVEWIADLRRAVNPAATPAEQLAQLTAAIAESMRARPQILRLLILLGLERSRVDPKLAASIQRVREHAKEFLRSAFKAALPLPEHAAGSVYAQLAELVLVFIDGIFITCELHPETNVERLLSWFATSLVAVAESLIRAAAHAPLEPSVPLRPAEPRDPAPPRVAEGPAGSKD